MRAHDDLDRRLADWMTEAASGPPPAGRFEQAMEATARRRPRPRWLAAPGSDWVGAAAHRPIVPAWPGLPRELVAAAIVALLVAAAIVGAALVGAQLLRPDRNPFQKSANNGWIAFAADENSPAAALGDHDIYLVGENRSARRIVGTDSDNLDQVCPAFSSDATRLAFGQGHRTSETGYLDAALVIADIDASGIVSDARTIPVGGTFPPPCPVWSPDGQRIAFIVPDTGEQPIGAGAVWVVTLDSGQVKVLPDVWASDLDWAPDGFRLAIASSDHPATLPGAGGPLLLYSTASGEVGPLPGASGVRSLAWSPDGSLIAYQRIRTPATLAGDGRVLTDAQEEIWTIGPDGSSRTLQTQPYVATHGIGPVWSPAGDRIAYQRICAAHPLHPAAPCREQHDVVLLTPGTTLSETKPVGNEVVLPVVRVAGADGPSVWFPFQVSWSPDGRKLLDVAWSEPVGPGQPNGSLIGLVVVDVGASSPPILLHEAGDISFGDGLWGRLPVTSAGSPAR